MAAEHVFGGEGMHIVALSGANIKHQSKGTSVRLAELMVEMLRKQAHLTGEIVALVDKRIEPCIGCGGCANSGDCVIDDDFAALYEKLINADGIVIVAPHYAPIPAKLCALLERVESIAFLNRWRDSTWPSPLGGKPVALIGHGGAAGEDVQRFYHEVVLIPLKNALGYPVEANVVRVDEWPHIGVVTGPAKVLSGDVFPIQEYDWLHIEKKLAPLAEQLVRALQMS